MPKLEDNNIESISQHDEIYKKIKFYENIILIKYRLSKQKNLINQIQPLQDNTPIYHVTKNKFELNPYCLYEFWYCDIYYLCQKTYINLVEENIDIAQENLNTMNLIYETFVSLHTEIKDFQYKDLNMKYLNTDTILSNLYLPKISSYILNTSEELKNTVENKIASNIKNILTLNYASQYIYYLINYCKRHGKFKNTHSAVKTTQCKFNNIIKENIETNINLIIDGRNKYIELLTGMDKRLREVTKSKKWLLNEKYFPDSQFTAKSMKTTLSLLINEQKDYLYKIQCDQKNMRNPDESLNYLFLIKPAYNQDTFTNWINSSPPVAYASILNNYGFIFLSKKLEIPFTKASAQISKIYGNPISKKTCFFINYD